VNHDRAKHLLPAYVDRETSLVRRLLLSRHVALCPSCLAEMEAIRAMGVALRISVPVHQAPPALAMRIASVLPREAPPSVIRQPFRLRIAAVAMAGGVAGVALTSAVTRLTPSLDPLVADVVADHVRSMMADHLTDVATSDQHLVKPWLSARLDLSPEVKDLVAEGYPLVGGRLDYVSGHRATAIVYRRDKHVINLFAYVSNDRSDAAPKLASRDGFNVIRWQMDGLSYAAVSDVDVGQLLAFVRLVAVDSLSVRRDAADVRHRQEWAVHSDGAVTN
jgi:anti-sigma factor RsiW